MTRRRIGRILAATLALAVASATMLVANPSAQAIPGLQRVVANSPTDTSSPKIVYAHCPPGTIAIDGGGLIDGGGDAQVRLTGLVPQGVSFKASASAGTAGYPHPWRLTAYAICAHRPPGLTGTSGFDPPGVSTQWWRTFRGGCPLGSQLIGFGAEAVDDSGNPATGVALQVLLPRDGLTEWVAQAYRIDDDYRQRWSLNGTSVCAHPAAGLTLVTGQQLPDGPVASISCPAGTKIHAMGGVINAAPGEVALVGVYPSTDLSTTMTFAEEVAGGASSTWQARAVAICAE